MRWQNMLVSTKRGLRYGDFDLFILLMEKSGRGSRALSG